MVGPLGFALLPVAAVFAVAYAVHHRRSPSPLVPRGLVRGRLVWALVVSLLVGVALTALIGLFGYRYIDNAAHAGGLIAGMLYAAIVFPASSSPSRPRSTITDRIAGGVAAAVLIASALFARHGVEYDERYVWD